MMADSDDAVTTWADALPPVDDDVLGPEPEVISVGEDAAPLMKLATVYKDLPWRPNYRKAAVSFVACCVFLVVFLVFFLGMGPVEPGSTNTPTSIREALMLSMMDPSAEPCTAAYEYSCGTYNDRYITSS